MKQFNTLLSSFLAVVFAVSTAIPLSALAAKSFSDVNGHWAEHDISSAVSRGYVEGYQNGTFRPNDSVTRAEFCKMMNSSLGLSGTSSVAFTDVSSGNWYYNEVRKALAAGYISGYDDNSFRANDRITRQEAAVIIARIVAASNNTNNLYEMQDSGAIDAWALDGAKTVYNKGYMTGDTQKKFNPKGNLTRAEAVKIIESILKNETMTASNVNITDPSQLSANTVYTGNVTLRLGSQYDASLQNCRILGNLDVNDGTTLRLYNTKVNNLFVSNASGEAEILAYGTSDIRNATVSGACTLEESNLSGAGFQAVTLSGSSLKNRSVNLSGDFSSVSLSHPANLYLLSGSIGHLTISSNAKGSQISLSSSTTVDQAEISGASDFSGKGTIRHANLQVSGSTFETPPLNIEGRTDLSPSIYPANGATNVSLSDSIRITFQEAVYTTSGNTPSASYLEDSVVELRKSSTSGSKVSISCSLSSNKREITVNPDSSLTKGTKYYVIIKSALKNSSGDRNDALTSSFSTTGSLTPEVYPVSGSDNIPITAAITLTFDQAIYQKNGGSISSTYLTDSVLELRRDSTSGTKVSFTASLSSDKRTITLSPNNTLSTSTRYYIIVKSDSLTGSGSISNAAQTFYFTTAGSSVLVPTITPSSGSSGVKPSTDIELIFPSSVYTTNGSAVNTSYLKDEVFSLRKGSSTGSSISFTASINSAKNVVTVSPSYTLSSNATYFLIVQADSLSDGTGSNRNYNDKMIFSFTTGSGTRATLEPTPYPSYGATDVSPDEITLTFSERIYQSGSGQSDVTGSYLQKNVLELRKGNSTGDSVPFSASISSSDRTVTIAPDWALSPGTKYYVIVKEGSLKNSRGNTNPRFSTYFTYGATSSKALKASISPADGSDGISRRPNISLSFEEALYDENGNSLTNSEPSKSYLKETAIELRSGSEYGAKISFSVNAFSNHRWISLTPNSALTEGTTYYVILPEDTLKNDEGVSNQRQVFRFTVGSHLDLQITPKDGTQNVSKTSAITLDFGEQVYTSRNVLLTNSNIASYMNSVATLRSSRSSISFWASMNSGGTGIILQPYNPLDANTTYTLTISEDSFSNQDGDQNSDISVSFSTVSEPALSSPTVSCSGVNASGKQEVRLSFNSSVLNRDKQALDAAYLESNLKLRKDSTSGTTVSFTASYANNIITLTPTTLLLPNSTYYVTAEQGILSDNSGNKNMAFDLSFRPKTPQVSVHVDSITETSANVAVDYDYPCAFSITVSDGASYQETLVSNFTPANLTGSFSRSLTNLTRATQYTVTVKYQYAGGSELVTSFPFKSYSASNSSVLSTLTVRDSEGTSNVGLGDPLHCSATVKSGQVTITPVTANGSATVHVIGAAPVPGSPDYELTLGSSAPATVTITVTAEDGVAVTEYTLTLTPR